MLRMSTIAGLTAASMLATTAVFLGATGSVASAAAPEASPAVSAEATGTDTTTTSVAATSSDAAAEGCARKVKVIYAGYGEAASGCLLRR